MTENHDKYEPLNFRKIPCKNSQVISKILDSAKNQTCTERDLDPFLDLIMTPATQKYHNKIGAELVYKGLRQYLKDDDDVRREICLNEFSGVERSGRPKLVSVYEKDQKLFGDVGEAYILPFITTGNSSPSLKWCVYNAPRAFDLPFLYDYQNHLIARFGEQLDNIAISKRIFTQLAKDLRQGSADVAYRIASDQAYHFRHQDQNLQSHMIAIFREHI